MQDQNSLFQFGPEKKFLEENNVQNVEIEAVWYDFSCNLYDI